MNIRTRASYEGASIIIGDGCDGLSFIACIESDDSNTGKQEEALAKLAALIDDYAGLLSANGVDLEETREEITERLYAASGNRAFSVGLTYRQENGVLGGAMLSSKGIWNDKNKVQLSITGFKLCGKNSEFQPVPFESSFRSQSYKDEVASLMHLRTQNAALNNIIGSMQDAFRGLKDNEKEHAIRHVNAFNRAVKDCVLLDDAPEERKKTSLVLLQYYASVAKGHSSVRMQLLGVAMAIGGALLVTLGGFAIAGMATGFIPLGMVGAWAVTVGVGAMLTGAGLFAYGRHQSCVSAAMSNMANALSQPPVLPQKGKDQSGDGGEQEPLLSVTLGRM